MSGISGYGSPNRLAAENQEANQTSQPALPAHTNNIENSPENNNGASQITAKETVTTQPNVGNDIKRKNNARKGPVDNQSETSYITVLTDSSQSYEALYSSEDDSLPKVINEHDEISKSTIVIRGSSVNLPTEDNKCDSTTETKIQAKKRPRGKTDGMKDKPEVTAHKSNTLLKANEPQDNVEKIEEAQVKESLKTPSAKSVKDQAQFSQAEDNEKTNKPAESTVKKEEIKKTGSFTTQFLVSAEKLEENRFKKLAQTRKLDDNADQRRKNDDMKQDHRTTVNCYEDSYILKINAAPAHKIDLQRGENCPEVSQLGVNNPTKPKAMSPGKLDILNDVLNIGEGTVFNLGDNLVEHRQPSGFIPQAPDNKIILTTDSQIENLRKIKRILEDNLKNSNNPDENNPACNQNAASKPELDENNACSTINDESRLTAAEKDVTQKNSNSHNATAEIPQETGVVVEVVKVIPDARRSSMASAALKEPQALNATNSLKQPISKRASIANRSEDASEVIQIILPEDKSALADEPKDSRKPGITEPEQQPQPSSERKPPSFQSLDQPYTSPEYEDLDMSQSSQTSSRFRLWWQRIRDRVIGAVMRVYNCFHCERIGPMSQARTQSQNAGGAHESSTAISSSAALELTQPSVLSKPTGSEYPPPKAVDVVNSEGLAEKSKSTTSGPEKSKSTRFTPEKSDSSEHPVTQMPMVKSTHVAPSR